MQTHTVTHFEIHQCLSCSKVSLKHDAAIWELPSWAGVFRLVCFPLFPLNLAMVIMAKQFDFSLFKCVFANYNVAFYADFGVKSS